MALPKNNTSCILWHAQYHLQYIFSFKDFQIFREILLKQILIIKLINREKYMSMNDYIFKLQEIVSAKIFLYLFIKIIL